MAEGYEVVTPALSGHVRGLTELSKELAAALTAADVTVTGDAYGQTGARLAAGLAAVARTGQDTLRAGIEALEQASLAMGATVTAYEQQEQARRDAFKKLGGDPS